MYEEYMQNLLGMQFTPYINTYEQADSNDTGYYMGMSNNMQYGGFDMMNRNSFMNNSSDLEDMYPEIYKIVYPMVKSACVHNTKPIAGELVDAIVQEIYDNVETDNIINVNINLDVANNSSNLAGEKADLGKNNETKTGQQEGRQGTAQVGNRQINNGLYDLIKILVLREFSGKNKYVPSYSRTAAPVNSNFVSRWR